MTWSTQCPGHLIHKWCHILYLCVEKKHKLVHTHCRENPDAGHLKESTDHNTNCLNNEAANGVYMMQVYYMAKSTNIVSYFIITALLYNMKSKLVRFLYGLTSWLIDMHEDHFIVRCQDGVELLVTNGGQLGHVPRLTLVH